MPRRTKRGDTPGKRHNDTQKKLEIQLRRKKVASLLPNGMTYREIADELKVSPATIAGDVKALLKEYKDHYLQNFDKWQSIQLRRYDVMINALWRDATNGNIKAITAVVTLIDKQNALMQLERVPGDAQDNPRFIQLVEVNKTYSDND